MAHYAKVLDGIVTNVIVAEEEFFKTFIDDSPGQWIQTSYNTRGGIHYQSDGDIPSEDQTKAMRYNFAGIGYHFDAVADAFYPPKPDGTQWELNTETYLWQRPQGWVDRPPAAETSETST